jgi:hypothetical protein
MTLQSQMGTRRSQTTMPSTRSAPQWDGTSPPSRLPTSLEPSRVHMNEGATVRRRTVQTKPSDERLIPSLIGIFEREPRTDLVCESSNMRAPSTRP